MATPSETDIRVFVGPNAGYYLQRWARLRQGERGGTGFNAVAFVFSGLWLPFRQMWRATFSYWGALVAAILLLQWVVHGTLLEEGPSDHLYILPIAGGLLCGFFGNRWYFRHVCRAIARIQKRGLSEDAYKKALDDRGGGSLAAALSMGIFWSLLSAGWVFVTSHTFQAGRISARLSEAIRRGPGTTVDFAEVNPRPWDRLYVFPPYTPLQTIESQLGFPWPQNHWTSIEWNDGVNLVVWVRDGKIAQWLEHPRQQELKELALPEGYARKDARFAVEQIKVGIGLAPGLEIGFENRLSLVPLKK